MLAWLPSPILLIINLILIPLNSVVIATPIMILGIFRFILPFIAAQRIIEKTNFYLYRIWVYDNTLIIKLTNKIKWQVTGDKLPELGNKSCIVISNHLSWADILLLSSLYGGQIPTTKFFMKHSLIYIPFVGLACYALGMPFLRRYSREKLLKNPKLAQQDIETTKKACRRLVLAPTSLINFVEGTRYTPVKARLSKSPYQHLNAPKTASLAIALGQIGPDIEYVFNTTMLYPNNAYPHKPFIDLLKGRMTDIRAHIEVIRVSSQMIGDYLSDKQFKHDFTMYVRDLWQQKDALIEKMLSEYNQKNT